MIGVQPSWGWKRTLKRKRHGVSTHMNYGKGWGDPTKYGVANGWEFVGPDRERKKYFYLRCKECGAQQSFIKYQLGKVRSCWDCWLVDSILRRPRLLTRLGPLIGALMTTNGRSEVEELERLYALPDPRYHPDPPE